MRALEGKYVNNVYSTSDQNDWHFATLDQTGDGTLTWKNQAGVSWTLTATGYKNKLSVGTDCPYYEHGYTIAAVQWDSTGERVTGISGPYNEFYDADSFAEYIIDSMVGTYENHEHDDGGKTNSHFVTLTKVDARTLTWADRTGVSCSLNYTGVANTLNVGEGCPEYHHGFTTATIVWKLKNVSGILGPGQELYSSDAFDNHILTLLDGTYENHWAGSKGTDDWKHVTITNNGDRSLTWTNRAGRSWSLYYKGDLEILEVGSDCQHFPAYSTARVRWEDGRPKGIFAPKGRFFDSDSYDSYLLGLLVGTYENHLYDNSGKNDTHYVTLAKAQPDSRSLIWSNRAHESWSLNYTGRHGKWSELIVGQDCPHYSSGYTVAAIERQWGHIRGVYGPGEEFYDADSFDDLVLSKIAGDYENHLYDNGGKNDWHYTTLTYNQGSRSLTWTNLAGVSWTLHYKGDSHSLDVGTDCPYYNSGHKVLTVMWDGDVVTGFRGPNQELYETRYH